jgi:hypothetical protein
MTEPRPEDDETHPIDKQDPAGDKAAEHTAPFDPFTDDDDDEALGDRGGEETVIQDATRVIPPADGAPAWAGRAGVPVPPPADRLRDSAPYPSAEPAQPRTWWTPILLGLLALGLLGVVVLVAWLMSRDDTPEPTVTSTPTPAITATPSLVPTTTAPSPTPSPTIQLVQVPANLVGMTQDEAVAALTQLGLAYAFEFRDSAAPENEVIATRPEGQELVPAGSTVTLVISKGGVTSPSPSTTATPSPAAN